MSFIYKLIFNHISLTSITDLNKIIISKYVSIIQLLLLLFFSKNKVTSFHSKLRNIK